MYFKVGVSWLRRASFVRIREVHENHMYLAIYTNKSNITFYKLNAFFMNSHYIHLFQSQWVFGDLKKPCSLMAFCIESCVAVGKLDNTPQIANRL